MRIFKCDRCKEIQGDHTKEAGSISIVSQGEHTDNGRHMDLCLTCFNNLKMWAGGYNNAKPMNTKYDGS